MTTREVAAVAGVSEGSIFYHFGDRAGLLLAVFAQVHMPLTDLRNRGLGEGDIRTTLVSYMRTVEAFLADSLLLLYSANSDAEVRDSVHSFIREHDMGQHRGIEILGAYLADAQERGELRADVDARAVAFLVLSTCANRVSMQLLMKHNKGMRGPEETADTILALMRL